MVGTVPKSEWQVIYGQVTWLLGVSVGPIFASRLLPTCVESFTDASRIARAGNAVQTSPSFCGCT